MGVVEEDDNAQSQRTTPHNSLIIYFPMHGPKLNDCNKGYEAVLGVISMELHVWRSCTLLQSLSALKHTRASRSAMFTETPLRTSSDTSKQLARSWKAGGQGFRGLRAGIFCSLIQSATGWGGLRSECLLCQSLQGLPKHTRKLQSPSHTALGWAGKVCRFVVLKPTTAIVNL